MEGLGDNVGIKCEQARDEQMFTSLEDFKARSGVNKTLVEKMSDMGILKDLSQETEDSEQMSLFDI
jgi:DNA polymerase-3 subunit alpha (Gram-positive type)